MWGFDPRDQAFVDPGVGTDFMGYCDNYWVSDYTYQALYNRLAVLGQNQKPSAVTSGTWRILHLDSDGSNSWGPPRTATRPHGSGTTTLRCTGPSGVENGTVDAVVVNHSQAGATLWMAAPPAGTRRVQGRVGTVSVDATMP